MKISDLLKRIKKLEAELYRQIERANRLEEDAKRYKFELETLYTTIEDLREEIADLNRQLHER